MKRFGLLALAMLSSLMIRAQTNAPAEPSPAPAAKASARPPAPRGPTRIDSDTVDFDLSAREATYRGHVRVDDPQMKLTCAWLVADVPQSGGHVSRIVAETNVVIDFLDDKGRTNCATGEKAVYTYQEHNGVTNEIITLTGNPKVENAQATMTGDEIVWDRANNHMSATNQKMIFRQNLDAVVAPTNAPAAAKTNPPPAAVQRNDLPAR